MKATRRDFMRTTALAAATAAGWRAFGIPGTAAAAAIGYGPLGPADEHGVRLPFGFSARLLAKTGVTIDGTDYVWHGEPDGAATFIHPEGGWVLACNSEVNGQGGGTSAIRFRPDGTVRSAYRILSGTKWNCAGGATPWGTWLSGEEFRNGLIWECDPFVPGQGTARPALGVFPHEASPTHVPTGHVYLTEDDYDGRLYRFRPDVFGDLSAGTLEAASVGDGGLVSWIKVSPKRPYRGKDTTVFDRGEGAWIAGDVLYFTTTDDDRVWALELNSMRIRTIYDGRGANIGEALHEPDNVTVHAPTGTPFVAEDADDIQLVQLVPSGSGWTAAPFLQFEGHDGSEVTGPVFSPDGTRLYVNSQRGFDGDGMTFEITGPFAS
jgi:secreted PhoX family phosphatase